MRLEFSTGVLNHDLQVPRPECSEKMQNFPTRKQNYAENIYTEGNHAARQIYPAARGCKSITMPRVITESRGACSSQRQSSSSIKTSRRA
ncbi:unnamed protein product [Trifolium pratense]|uniref:Uncharacterized protein n=1 Tax=Trifolium pratense TaxID=57577 RepID=A0ACB0J137_TRIPR|nr:unnamed protein product [Trifolium pratense]